MAPQPAAALMTSSESTETPKAPPGGRVTRVARALRRGPMLHNVGAAVGVQFALLVSGTLSARLLGPEGRGYAAILTAWPSAIGQLGAVGMSLAATYYLSSQRIGGRELVTLLRRAAAWQISILFVINASVIIGYTAISGAPILTAALISLMFMPAGLFGDYGFALLLGARDHGTVALFRTVGPAVYALGLVGLFAFDVDSLTAVVTMSVGGLMVGGLCALRRGLMTTRTIAATDSVIDRLGETEARRELLAFGRRGYLGYVSPVDTFRLDQLVVGFLLSPSALGIYVVGAAFTNFGRMVAMNIGLSATPEIARHQDPQALRAAIRHTMMLAALILTSVTVALCGFVIVAIPALFGSAFKPSIPIAELLLVAGWLLSMKRITVDVMRGAGEPRVGTRAEIVNLVAFLAGCVPLGLWLGGEGVAIALVVGAACGSALLLSSLRQLYRGDAVS